MANSNEPLDRDTLDFVKVMPAGAISRIRTEDNSSFTAFLDLGPRVYVSDAAPMGCSGPTPSSAAEFMKAWLLDDLSCGARGGKRQYQPHWGSYDIVYRIGEYWKSKAARLKAEGIEFEVTPCSSVVTSPAAQVESTYEGWTNSATYLVNLYQSQATDLYEKVASLFKSNTLTDRTLQALAKVDRTARNDEKYGYHGGVLYLDPWALGSVNWAELVDNWKNELTVYTSDSGST
jgi:hypothetical protein